MKISIIIPVYGVEKYIDRHIKSLLSQEYGDLEFVFVNDCSKDRSMEILHEYLPMFDSARQEVRIINHNHNRGLAAARLTGLEHSTGDYVWFVDSDDWIDSRSSVLLSEVIESYAPDIVQFSHVEESLKGEVKRVNGGVTTEKLLWLRTYPCIWRHVFRRSFLIENELYPVEGINFGEDFVMTSRAFSLTSDVIVLSDAFLYHYNNMNNDSYTHNLNTRCILDRINGCNAIFDYFENKDMLDWVKPSLFYVYLRRYIEVCHVDSDYESKKMAYNNLSKLYPRLCPAINWATGHGFSWLLFFCLRAFRWMKYDFLSFLPKSNSTKCN